MNAREETIAFVECLKLGIEIKRTVSREKVVGQDPRFLWRAGYFCPIRRYWIFTDKHLTLHKAVEEAKLNGGL